MPVADLSEKDLAMAKAKIVHILCASENPIAPPENRLALLSAIDKIRRTCTYIQLDAQKIEVTVIDQERPDCSKPSY